MSEFSESKNIKQKTKNMASNNIEALNLSLELAELEQITRTTPTVPTVEFFKNNKSGIDLAYYNVHFHFKNQSNQIVNYVCATKNCSFSISLAVDQTTKKLKDPYEITNISKDENHQPLSLSDLIHFNSPVSSIHWDLPNGKIKVKCEEKIHEADLVLVTCSLGVLKEKADKLFYPQLPKRKIRAIAVCSNF